MILVLAFVFCVAFSAGVVVLGMCQAAAAGDRAMEEYFYAAVLRPPLPPASEREPLSSREPKPELAGSAARAPSTS